MRTPGCVSCFNAMNREELLARWRAEGWLHLPRFFGEAEFDACAMCDRAARSACARCHSLAHNGPLMSVLSDPVTDGRRHRQRHRNRSADSFARGYVNAAAMLLHDSVGDGHAEPSAGREIRSERLEKASLVGVVHAAAIITEHYIVVIAPNLGRDEQRAAIGHGLHGVAGDIPEDLLDLIAVADDGV